MTGGTANTGAVLESQEHNCGHGSLRQPGLYEVYSVAIPSRCGADKVATIMVDPGSDTNYVRHDFARSLGLDGTPYSCFLKVVDMEYVKKESAKYAFEIVDKEGVGHHIDALGLDTITTLPEEPDLEPVLHLLDRLPGGILDRPQGRVDILLGLGSSALHGKTRMEWDNLRLLEMVATT